MAKATNISTATTTVVSARPCCLKRVTINGGTMGAVTIYDNASAASGTLVATIAAPLPGDTFEYEADLVNGCVIVTAAATDLTASTV